MKPKTMLPAASLAIVARYVRDSFKELDALRLAQPELAKWLTHKTGIPVTISHIDKICARADVHFRPGRGENVAPIPSAPTASATPQAKIEGPLFVTTSGRHMALQDAPVDELQYWVGVCTSELGRRARNAPQQAPAAPDLFGTPDNDDILS